jgi:hypothetical protein
MRDKIEKRDRRRVLYVELREGTLHAHVWLEKGNLNVSEVPAARHGHVKPPVMHVMPFMVRPVRSQILEHTVTVTLVRSPNLLLYSW